MPSTVKLTYNQSLIDIAINNYGDSKAVFELAKANNLQASDEVSAGTTLILPDYSPIQKPSTLQVIKEVRSKKIAVLPNQNLMDIAIQNLGSSEALLTLAKQNGIAVSDILTPETVLNLPEILGIKTERFFWNSGLNVATGYQDNLKPAVFCEVANICEIANICELT